MRRRSIDRELQDLKPRFFYRLPRGLEALAAILPRLFALFLCTTVLPAHARSGPVLERGLLAERYFAADAPWFVDNIPFLEIDDAEIQQIYYYRWKLFRAHIREIGTQGTTLLEFLPDVSWAREPYTDLNDSASFHLAEGRWLRNPTIVDDLIDHEYTGGGNDRHFSESIAAATVATTLVTDDPAPALRHLDTMQHIYNLWDDHLDRQRNLYWIEPLADATEYTIASIDASGAGFEDKTGAGDSENGFTGGYAFRPSINSYMFANALAISHLALLDGKPQVAAVYRLRAEAIRTSVLKQLWNPDLQHFTDRYQRSTKYVQAGDFIRGRELVGYTPWFYELPPREPGGAAQYSTAWKHALDASELGGANGLRTVEPSYRRYLEQYRYDRPTGLRECQWNGPSWPFQTSQTLTALANLLDDYPPSALTPDDYVRLLRQYTQQHFLTASHPDLQEDYDPDRGGPIVGLPRSHHYAHSTYNDLILSGLIGVRPRADNILEVSPLLPSSASVQPIRYFALQNLRYHGHDVDVLYDQDGSRYHRGAGLSLYVDGGLAAGPSPLGKLQIRLPKAAVLQPQRREDLAVNVGVPGFPSATASSTLVGSSIAEAIDGRMWFFPEIPNGWSPAANGDRESWYTVDFGRSRTVAMIQLNFFGDGALYKAPTAFRLQYDSGSGWSDVPRQNGLPAKPFANGSIDVRFDPLSASRIRVVLTNPVAPARLRLVELKAFGPAHPQQ